MRRIILSFTALGAVLASPAFAQTSTTTAQPTYMVPMYMAPSGAQQTNGTAVYNSGAQPLPMEQMIAGKNAPSYNYNNTAVQPYTGFNSGSTSLSGVTSIGALTPEQMSMVQQQQNAQALAYQNEYLASLQGGQQPAQAGTSSTYQGSAFSKLYTGSEEKKVPTRRQVIYKQMNNPLTTPPRLFNPDQ